MDGVVYTPVAGSDPGVRLQYVYLDSKEFQLLLGGAAQFSIKYIVRGSNLVG